MEEVIITLQSRSQKHFTTEGTEKVTTGHSAGGTNKLLLTASCSLLAFLRNSVSLW